MGKDPNESALQLERLRAMHQETTDPMAARLLADILSEMEAAAVRSKKDADNNPRPESEPNRRAI